MTSGAKNPRLLIGSEWRETGWTNPVINPYSGEEFAQVPLGNAKTVDEAIEVAHEAFEVTRAQAPHARGDLLARVARRIEERRADFVETMITEAGKPYMFADGEVTRSIITFTVAGEEARRQQGELLDVDAYAPGSGHFGLVRRFPLGVISAVHQGSRLDYALRVVSLSGLSLPSFWLGLLILMASVSLFGTMPIFNPNPKTWTEALAIYCVPAMAVGFRSAALTMRITRSSMLEILRQDYIRTARAKGASEASVNYRHALKNAILPVITVIGIEAAFLIGGLIVTETVFNIPGVARFLVEALRWRDYPIVQNIVMLIAVVVVVANFTVDMLYAAIDPRIRYGD